MAHTISFFLSLDSPTLGGLCGCAMSERDDDDVIIVIIVIIVMFVQILIF